MNIIQPFSSRLPQSVRFGGGYGSDSSSDEEDVETLRAKLQQSLQHVARGSDTFQVSSSSRKLEFHRPVSPDRTQPAELPPQLKDLSSKANDFIPAIGGKYDHPLPEARRVEASQEAAKGFDLEEMAARQLEEQRTIRENKAAAKIKWLQMGFFSLVAATATAVGVPVLAHPHSAAATWSVVGAIVKPLVNMFNLGAELATNPQRKSGMQELISGVKSFWQKGLNFLGMGKRSSSSSTRFSGDPLSDKPSRPGVKGLIRFGMHRMDKPKTQQKQSQAAPRQISEETVRNEAVQASETLLQRLKQTKTDGETVMAAQEFQKSVLRTAHDYILAHGTEQEKAKVRKIQAFQRDLEALYQAMPEDMDTYEELSKPAQNHLRQMIFETLTSDLPELTDWGRQQGRAIGMTEAQIQRAINSAGSSSRTTSDKR